MLLPHPFIEIVHIHPAELLIQNVNAGVAYPHEIVRFHYGLGAAVLTFAIMVLVESSIVISH